jgi:hypothetical protein
MMIEKKMTAAQKAESDAYLQWEHENMHVVVKMEHVAPYTLHLVFDNGIEKTINFRDFVFHPDAGRQYHKMQDLTYFNQVSLQDGHLTWPNRWDFNPAMLYTWEGESWKNWLLQK